MSKKKLKAKSSPGFFMAAAVVVVATGVGIWTMKNTSSPIKTPPEKPTVPSRVVIGREQTVNTYKLKIINQEPKLVVERHRVSVSKEPHVEAVKALIAKNELVPVGTKLIGLEVKDETAYVNFSKEIQENFTGGSDAEALLISSIVYTLTDFKDIKKVQILVEGKRVESLGDHMDISQPLGKQDCEGKAE